MSTRSDEYVYENGFGPVPVNNRPGEIADTEEKSRAAKEYLDFASGTERVRIMREFPVEYDEWLTERDY
jgi:hypothetical protein